MVAKRVSTGAFDRNGTEIFVGTRLKWIRDDRFFVSGPKKGQLKQKGAEFVAGTVIVIKDKIAVQSTGGHKFWCESDGAREKRDTFSRLPGGLNFMSMLDYIEVIA